MITLKLVVGGEEVGDCGAGEGISQVIFYNFVPAAGVDMVVDHLVISPTP